MIGYLFGAAACNSIVTIAKFTVGRLRPHFFDVCNPNFETIDCGSPEHPIFVTNYVCQGNQNLFSTNSIQNEIELKNALDNAHVSFMSGHSCFMFQAAVFVILYLQARFVNIKAMRENGCVFLGKYDYSLNFSIKTKIKNTDFKKVQTCLMGPM